MRAEDWDEVVQAKPAEDLNTTKGGIKLSISKCLL